MGKDFNVLLPREEEERLARVRARKAEETGDEISVRTSALGENSVGILQN